MESEAFQRLPRSFPEASQDAPKLPRIRPYPASAYTEDSKRCSRCSRNRSPNSRKAPRCLVGWRPYLWKIWPRPGGEYTFRFGESRPRQSVFRKHRACTVDRSRYLRFRCLVFKGMHGPPAKEPSQVTRQRSQMDMGKQKGFALHMR